MTRKGASELPADQAARTRFITELDGNFSVLAPAGVGKTKALVDRVVEIATGDPARAAEWLPQLVVVTYTNKAADEMYQRARNAIIEQRVGLPVLTQFNHAFFGTLHSFCVRLLRTHGHLCGLPAQFEPVENDDELWQEFIRQTDRLAPGVPSDLVQQVTRLVPMDHVLHLARSVRPEAYAVLDQPFPPAPEVDLRGLLGHEGDKRSAANIERSQRMASEWKAAWTEGASYAPLPKSASSAKAFAESWKNAFAPLRAWLGPASLRVAVELAAAYRAYRRQRGALTYDDQVELAWELVRDPVAGRRLREQGFRIILDEAQDTDPVQFSILLELARPASARGIWMESGGAAPEPGRFCMVGDPQQSIYGERADLGWYQQVREELTKARAADEVVFTVTFRCDQAIIAAVNELVQPMFERAEGQVTYHPLTARPNAGPGQVVRWSPTPLPDGVEGVDPVSMHEARELAQWLRKQGHAGLEAGSWSEVAVLAPRTRWLQTLAAAFREEGLLPQVHSERSVQADDPVYAWFTALMTILARPADGFEIVGVLREIYGLSDAALAHFAKGDGACWNLSRPVVASDEVTRVLQTLSAIWSDVSGLPLRDAARLAVERTALRDRLATLPGVEEHLDESLERLLVQAAMAEDQGLSLAEFAEQLRDGMTDTVAARPVVKDAVQLLTSYKAKGLQWDAVVVPLMFRPIGDNKQYPALIRSRPGVPPLVAFSSHDMGEARDGVEQRRRQELQRLLYVALTRAKRTLVVVDDYALFPTNKPNRSQADLLGMLDTEGHRVFNETWNSLADVLQPVRATAAPAPTAVPDDFDAVPADALARAAAHAQAVPRRVLPYQLGEAEARTERAMAEPETTRSVGAESARLYGIWWHESIEHLDWSRRDAWPTAWTQALAGCPDPARGEREGAALFASDLARRLAAAGLVRHREMPILWRRSATECVEGVIDLAVWDPAIQCWLIVDWKTNLIRPDGHEHLRAMYEPQLRAYAEALHEITGASVEAGVHSTVTGGWVPCVQIP